MLCRHAVQPRTAACCAGNAEQQLPWTLGTYYTKKQTRATDSLGRFIRTPDAIAEPAAWTHDTKWALAISVSAVRSRHVLQLHACSTAALSLPCFCSAAQVVAREADMPAAELQARVQSLLAVLPDVMSPGPQQPKPGDVARLACHVEDVAAKLLLLKEAFPDADVSRLAAANTQQLLSPLPEFQAALCQASTGQLCAGGSALC